MNRNKCDICWWPRGGGSDECVIQFSIASTYILYANVILPLFIEN